MVEGVFRIHHYLVYRYKLGKISKYNTLIYDAYQGIRKEIVNQSTKERGLIKVEPHPFLLYKPEPHQHYETININGNGYRGESVNWNERGFKIALLGGSAVFGSGALSDDRTIAGYLQKLLRSQHHNIDIDVINCGTPGYTSDQELILYERELCGKIDMLIVFDAANDIWAPTNFDLDKVGFPYEFKRYKDMLKHPLLCEIDRILKRLMSYEKLSRRIGIYMKRKKEESLTEFLRDKRIKAMTENYIKNIRIMDLIAGDSGIPAIFCLQPLLLIEKKNMTETERKIYDREVNWGYSINKPEEYFEQAYDSIRREFEKLRGENILAFDMTDIFSSQVDTIYIDICHFGDKGHQLVAERLASIVGKHIRD